MCVTLLVARSQLWIDRCDHACSLGAYGRAVNRFRGLPAAAGLQQLQEVLAYSRELAVSYSGLLLTMDMFPQVQALMNRVECAWRWRHRLAAEGVTQECHAPWQRHGSCRVLCTLSEQTKVGADRGGCLCKRNKLCMQCTCMDQVHPDMMLLCCSRKRRSSGARCSCWTRWRRAASPAAPRHRCRRSFWRSLRRVSRRRACPTSSQPSVQPSARNLKLWSLRLKHLAAGVRGVRHAA